MAAAKFKAATLSVIKIRYPFVKNGQQRLLQFTHKNNTQKNHTDAQANA